MPVMSLTEISLGEKSVGVSCHTGLLDANLFNINLHLFICSLSTVISFYQFINNLKLAFY